MKGYMCVEVKHHKGVGKKIEEWKRNGWRLHTYSAGGYPGGVGHYLLFERVSG